MFKKIALALLTTLMIISYTTSCQSVEKQDGVSYKLNKDKKSYTITQVERCDTEVKFDIYNGKPITVIGNEAFEKMDHIQSVIISDHVLEIGDDAFHWSPELSHLVIGQNVQIIGCRAFKDCDNLSAVVIPDSVIQIKEEAFAICDDNLKYVYIGKGVVSIDDFAFESNLSLAVVTLPQNIATIGKGAFDDCQKLTYVYYEGTAEDFAKVQVGERNDPLLYHLYYYSATKPTVAGNYWHYDDQGNHVAW